MTFLKRILICITAVCASSIIVSMSFSQPAMAAYHNTRNNCIHNGKNVMFGSFLYNGANYGFTLSFNYSSATGKISDIIYEADGYGNGSKISSGKLTSDGTTLIIEGKASGTYTYIKATVKRRGVMKGKMIRGTHNGSCTLTIQ